MASTVAMTTQSDQKTVALLGCGSIARRYVEGMSRFPNLRLVGVADVQQSAADVLAAEAGVQSYASIDELLADPAIDIVVNITPPSVHAESTSKALAAGKAVYVEKPMAASVRDAYGMLDAADRHGLALAVAPDTFLGTAGRTARRAIDAGLIGSPVGATAFVTHSHAETWHPDPTFLFKPGGGPALDLGPYYLTALVNLLGPVTQVSGFARIGAPVRTVTAPDRRVEHIDVEVATHSTAMLRFASGVLGTVLMSSDVWHSGLPRIEIYGELGTLTLPDPNGFDGDVRFRGHHDDDWTVLKPVGSPDGAEGEPVQLLRGYGVADLAAHLASASPLRPSAGLALHVLEVLEAVQTSSDEGRLIDIETRPERPASVPVSATHPIREGASA